MADFSLDYSIEYSDSNSSCTIRFACFDVPNSVSIHNIDLLDGDVESLLISCRNQCLELHRLWSFTMRGSDISRINTTGWDAEVSKHTVSLIASMRKFHELEPLFDFTVGPASYLWKNPQSLPQQEDIERALSHVGAEKVWAEGDLVVKSDPAARVDVGGAAKGYAADLLVALLYEAGVTSADIDLGGNLYLLGNHSDGRLWRVLVKCPNGMDVEPIVLEVSDASVVTSGSYERFVEIDGRRYQHIVDPRTGWPSESDIVSATVVDPSSLRADMLATTLLLTGSGEFDSFVRRHPANTFIAITADAQVLRHYPSSDTKTVGMSSGFGTADGLN